MLIIPSKQLLLISAEQSKQIFLFDPKTSSVITKYHTEPSLSKTLAYYPHSNQFITTYNNKTFLNIWSTDSQEPINKVSTLDIISFLLISKDKNVLFAGTQNGNLSIWELPTGILIRKVSIHSCQIKKIIEYKPGYLMTSTKNQIKIWSLSSFYIQTERSTPIKIINSILDIIDVDYARNIFMVLTSKSVTYYLGGNQHNPFPQLNKQDIQFATKLCTSKSHLYIGDFQGSIHVNEIIANENSYEVAFKLNQSNQSMEVSKLSKRTVLKGQNKHPITCLIHLKTLPFLISGNTEGDVSIWQNHQLKKSIKLFKTSIKFIHNIPKPLEQKISQNLKIRPMTKYEQNKETQPLQIDVQRLKFDRQLENSQQFDFKQQIQSVQEQLSNQMILQRMLEVLNRPEDILKGKIAQLQSQKQILIKANLHFSQILCEEKQINKQTFDF